MSYATHPHHDHSLHGLARSFEPVESLVHRVGATLNLWYDRWSSRKQLAALDDRMLQDIGVTRADILKEINKPFWRA